MVSMRSALSRAGPSRAQAVADEHREPVEALGQPRQRALLDVIREHQGIALAGGVPRLRDAVPAPVAHDRKGVARGGTERELLGTLRGFSVPPLVENGPELRLGLVPRQVELHRDGLAEPVAVDADPVAAEIPGEHGNGIEGEPADALSESLLESGAEFGLEGLLEGPRAQDPGQLPPEGALPGRQPHDVLREQVELASRAVPVRLHGFPVAELAVHAGLGQVIQQPAVVLGREQVLEVDVVEGCRLESARLDTADEIRAPVRRGGRCDVAVNSQRPHLHLLFLASASVTTKFGSIILVLSLARRTGKTGAVRSMPTSLSTLR